MTEDDIRASLGDSIHYCFGEALLKKKVRCIQSTTLLESMVPEIMKHVSRGITIKSSELQNTKDNPDSEDSLSAFQDILVLTTLILKACLSQYKISTPESASENSKTTLPEDKPSQCSEGNFKTEAQTFQGEEENSSCDSDSISFSPGEVKSNSAKVFDNFMVQDVAGKSNKKLNNSPPKPMPKEEEGFMARVRTFFKRPSNKVFPFHDPGSAESYQTSNQEDKEKTSSSLESTKRKKLPKWLSWIFSFSFQN